MKKQIRKHVFETNSSSVHSIVFSKKGLQRNNIPIDEANNLVVRMTSYFGKNYHIYNTQEEKLEYLIVLLLSSAGIYYEEDLNKLYDDYYFKDLEKYICEYTNTNKIKLEIDDDYEYGFSIDHQSQPYYGFGDSVSSDKDSIINFVFNEDVFLETRSD